MDAELLALSDARAGLPEFTGANLTERLLNGRNEARARLLKYTSAIRYDASSAEDLMHEISSWTERNADIIKQRMADPATDTLPEQVALEFGAKKAQQYVIAGYSLAAEGLGPWASGALLQKMAVDARIPEPWVREDADRRLDVFASIVKLDDDGDLASIFEPEKHAQQQAQGLGTLPALITAIGGKWVVIGLVLLFTVTVALFLVYSYSMEKLRLNNKVMRDLCTEAKKAGDTEVVKECIRASEEGQASPLGSVVGDVTKIALLIGAVYVAARVVPDLMKRRARSTA